MVMRYCRIDGGNFGDDLNLWLWPTLFPDLSELQGRAVFYGTGTLLDGQHDSPVPKVVLGTGLGHPGMVKPDPHWDFRWVRGPCSAQAFHLPRKLAVGDSALLWSGLTPGHDEHGPVGLIPHYRTWDTYDWAAVAARAGMRGISPRQTPLQVLEQMRGCSRILSESLHGAIFADAIGIPWAACVLAHRFNEFKWRDWLATVDRPFAPFVINRGLVSGIAPAKAIANRMARWVNYQRHTRHPELRPVAPATDSEADRVAEALLLYSRGDAHFAVSAPALIARQKQQMLELCAAFARDYHLTLSVPEADPCALAASSRQRAGPCSRLRLAV